MHRWNDLPAHVQKHWSHRPASLQTASLQAPRTVPQLPPSPPGSMGTGAKVAIGAVAIVGIVAIVLYARNASAATAPGGGGTGPSPSPAGISPTDGGRGQNATALANAIQTGGGYCASSIPAIKAYQTSAGLNADGLPGPLTMNALKSDLATMGSSFPLVGTIAIYPWTGGWTNGNVPAAFADNTGTTWSSGGATCSQ